MPTIKNLTTEWRIRELGYCRFIEVGIPIDRFYSSSKSCFHILDVYLKTIESFRAEMTLSRPFHCFGLIASTSVYCALSVKLKIVNSAGSQGMFNENLQTRRIRPCSNEVIQD